MADLSFFVELQLVIVALYLVYALAIHRRVSILLSRIFLLLIIPVSLVIASMDIPITRTSAESEAMSGYQLNLVTDVPIQASSAELVSSHASSGGGDITSLGVQTEQVQTQAYASGSSLGVWDYMMLVYVCGVVGMFIWTVMGIIRLCRLVSKCPKYDFAGSRVIFRDQNSAAFSFFGYICVNESLRDSASLGMILSHEQQHRKCHHTLDLIFMSIQRILLWFNPVTWYMTRDMRQIHEYEVDQRVVAQGVPLAEYLELLICSDRVDAVAALASSMSYSLTNKRLLMITKKFGRSSMARLLLVVPVLVVMVALFSVSIRAEKKSDKMVLMSGFRTDALQSGRQLTETFAEQAAAKEPIVQVVKDANAAEYVTVSFYDQAKSESGKQMMSVIYDTAPIAQSYNVSHSGLDPKNHISFDDYSISYRLEIAGANQPDILFMYNESSKDDLEKMFQKISRLKLDKGAIIKNFDMRISRIEYIPAHVQDKNNKGRGVIMVALDDIPQYEINESLRALTKVSRGAKFVAPAIMDCSMGVPMDLAIQHPMVLLRTAEGKFIEVRNFFGLTKDPKDLVASINRNYIEKFDKIPYTEAINKFGSRAINGAVIFYLKPFEGPLVNIMPTVKRCIEERQLVHWRDRLDCYVLTPEQMKITDKHGISDVRHTEKETFVTFSEPIYWDINWVSVPDSYVLEDDNTSDRYHVRRAEGGMPLNKLWTVNGIKDSNLAITLVFPRVKKDSKGIFTLKTIKDPSYEMPLNSSNGNKEYKFDINDYVSKTETDKHTNFY